MTPSADVRVLLPSESETRRRTWPLPVFIFLLAWQIVLVWIFQHFASQDGPSHLYNAVLIRGFHDPAWHRVPEFYHLNSRLVPNWFTFVVLAGLSYLFSPATAEKMLVTGYFVFFPLSFVYVLRTLTKDVWHFEIWGLLPFSDCVVCIYTIALYDYYRITLPYFYLIASRETGPAFLEVRPRTPLQIS